MSQAATFRRPIVHATHANHTRQEPVALAVRNAYSVSMSMPARSQDRAAGVYCTNGLVSPLPSVLARAILSDTITTPGCYTRSKKRAGLMYRQSFRVIVDDNGQG